MDEVYHRSGRVCVCVCVCVCLVTMLSPATLFARSVLECEKLVRKSYQDNGLVYKSSSEDESRGAGPLSSEVIEIDDEDDDDDVIAVGCCKLGRHPSKRCPELTTSHHEYFMVDMIVLHKHPGYLLSNGAVTNTVGG